MALSFDAVNSARNSAKNTTSPTLNHTCAAGAVLYVSVALGNTAVDPTGVTYNSVAMTKIATNNNGGSSITLWQLTNPTTGSSQAVVATWANNSACIIASQSILGCFFSSPLGAINQTAGATSASATAPLTTTQANSLILDFLFDGASAGDTITASGTNQTQRYQQRAFVGEDTVAAGSTMTTTTTGTYTPTYTLSISRIWIMISVEIVATGTLNIGVTDTQGSIDNVTLNPPLIIATDTQGSSDSTKANVGFSNSTKSSSSWTNSRKS